MRKILYMRPDGGLSVVHPVEGARLAFSVTLKDGTVVGSVSNESRRIDTFFRGWPVADAVAEWAETEDEFVARIAAKDVPAGVPFEIVAESVIPADRTFRNAWTWTAGSGTVNHDMPKALAIAQENIRQARAPKLTALDVEFMRAVEAGDAAKQAQVAAQKQRLRDATADPRITQAPTPNALKAAMQAVISEL